MTRVALAVSALLVAGGVAWWSKLPSSPRDESVTTTAMKPEGETLARLRTRADEEPCDRRRIIELLEQTLRDGNHREVLDRSARFFAKCGDYPRLRELRYEAHKQLSDWTSAALDAGKLIEADPHNANYRAWRGIVYEWSGDLTRAAEDYEQALILKPSLGDLPINLAAAYEKLGKPCSAILPLAQVVTYYPEAANAEAIQRRIARLAALGECAWSAGQGHAVIRRRPGSQVMVARVRINQHDCGKFIVDTGATLVALSRRTADLLAIELTGKPQLYAQTANGVAIGHAVVLNEIAVQGVRAARVPAAVIDDLGAVDGLLGMSFLSRFKFHHADGVFEIEARGRSASDGAMQ